MSKREIQQNTTFGVVKATWETVNDGMIEVRYGSNVKRTQAGGSEASNDFIARNMLQGMIASDLAEPED